MATLSMVTSVLGRIPIASEVYVLKTNHKSTVQWKTIESSIPDSVSAVQNVTNTSDVESELEAFASLVEVSMNGLIGNFLNIL
ncbi:unnamed protein product [Lupinus luteus]|uniref:Uncharacterized protein n=1 Tax=Lupinus luteus TaxID=3873 RepID=A0AAV1WTM2_LUPLU